MNGSSKENAKRQSKIIEFLGGLENFHKYENSKSNEDKVNVIYHSPMMQSLFKTQKEMFKTADETYKNERESKRLRELGNTAFKQMRDQKAIELYTDAAAYADQVLFCLRFYKKKFDCLIEEYS